MVPDSSALSSQHEVADESVESLRAQIKEIEDKWNDELERLETARKDKEELERILRVLQTLIEYEREATLKMEAVVQETKDALGIPDEASCPAQGPVYDPSRSTGSSSSGDSSVLEFDLVYNPNADLPVPLAAPSTSPPPPLPDADAQVDSLSPLLETPIKPASKPKRTLNWKSRITSILISTNNHNHANQSSPSLHSLNNASPSSCDDASPRGAKSKRPAKSQKRPSQDSENLWTAGRRRTMGSAGSKFANRANRDINRKKSRDLSSILQS